LWLVANGGVAPFDGDLDEYQRLVLSDRRGNAKSEKGNGASNKADARKASAQKRAELAALKKRISEAETAQQKLSAEIAKLDAALSDPDLFVSDPAKGAALSKARAEAADKLAAAEQDWLEASGALDEASA
jgi:ATP-binding cassette subfamily F protein 3